MEKRKMLRVRQKRVLTGILCAVLLVSNDAFVVFHSYAAETGLVEETGKEDGGQGGLSEENRGTDSQEIEGNTDDELDSAEGYGGKQEGDGAQDGESASGKNENVEGGNGEGTDAEVEIEEDGGNSAEETVSENTMEDNTEAVTAGGQAVTALGKCGDNLTWTLEDGTLTISGTGEMYHDYWGGSNKAPWRSYSDSIYRLVIKPGVTDIGQYAFYECSNLKTLSIPDSVTSIAESAFSYCSNLMTLSIPDSVTHIGKFAFEYCSSLSSVVIPDGVEKIYDAAFSHCDSLKKVTLPTSVTTLGLSVFSGCTSLVSAGPIGGGYDFEFGWIDAIPSNAFYGSELKYILIPNGTTKIGTDAFAYCENLEKVVIPASVNMLGNHVYDGHNQLITAGPIGGGYNIEYGWIDAIPDHAFDHCSKLKEIQISGSISSIGAYAFNFCSSLENLIIPDSVREIGDDAFNNCNAILELIIPNNVYKIGGKAFSQCNRLSKMIIPNNVTQIGLEIFYGCDNLEHVSLSNQLTSIQGTFAKCTNLSSVSIPSSVKEIGYMTFYDCSKLSDIYYSGSEAQWKGIEFSSDCKTALSNVAIHYNSEWDIIKDPTDITQNDITVNGKGYAYANFILKNNTGKIQQNAKITYTINDSSYEAVSDGKGFVVVKSPLLENTTGKDEKRTITVQNMTLHYASGKTETLGYKVTMNVTVAPLSFTQTWELGAKGLLSGGIGFGAGVTVGVAEVETNLAKAEIKGTAGGTMSVEHSFEGGDRNLILRQNYESKVAASAKVGPAAKAGVLGQDLDIGIANAGAGVASGKTVGIGLKLKHYDPTNTEQIANIGAFMLGSQAQAGGNIMMLQLAEQAGLDFWNLEQCGASISVDATADIGSFEIENVAEGKLASVGAEQMVRYNVKKDKTDSSKELTFGYEAVGTAGVGEIGIAGIKDGIFSGTNSRNLQINAELDARNQVVNVTVKKEEKSEQGFLYKKGTVESVAVTYDRENVEQMKETVGTIGNFVSGSTQYILGDAQEDLYKQLDITPVKGSYLATKTEQEMTDVDFEIGLELGVGIDAGIGFEGASSCEYETIGGTYEGGQRYITNTNEIEAAVKEKSYSINQLIEEPLKTIWEKVKGFLQDNADKLINGVQNGFAAIEQGVLGPAGQWIVHIVSLKEGKTKSAGLQSYEITAYSTEMLSAEMPYGNMEADVNQYKVYTVGDPYSVYVTDEAGNEIADYSSQPLTLKLSYTDEMLANAGLIETEANRIAVYMYSQEFCGYVCVGGTVDTVAKTVSVEITKPGQYVLAADGTAPAVKNITVSQNTNRPLITVEFMETSGFGEFSMKLDDEEVISTADWNKYYNRIYNSFVYQVEKELAAGKHTCSVYAVDTAGNAMSVPYEVEFYIGRAPAGDVLEENIPPDGIIPDGIWAAGIGDYTYTGKSIIQSFRLYDGKKRLQEKTDYTVSYKNNKAAYVYSEEDYKAFEENLQKTEKRAKTGSFDPKKAPQAVIQMKGNYAGNKIVYFRIEPADLSEDAFEADNLTVTYTGKKQTPVPKLTWNGKALKYGTDFYVSEYDSTKSDKNAFKKSQIYTLTLIGKQNFTGELLITLTISQSEKQIAMDKVTVKGIKKVTWTGKQITQPDFTVKYKNITLSAENGDYTVHWGTNTDVGIGMVTLVGTEEDRDGDGFSFIGTKKVSFQITGNAMNRVSVSGVEKKYTYTGNAIEPSAKLTYMVNKNANAVILTEGIHYTVTYQNNVDKGTAEILFTGLASGGYTGTKKIYFNIVSSEIGNTTGGTEIQIAFAYSKNVKNGVYSAPYMKGGAKPEVMVTSGEKTLTEGKDYKIKYTNNRKVALLTDTKAPTVIVTGKGNYKGTKSVKFTILAKELSNENGIAVIAKDKIAGTRANGYRQAFKVYDADGKTLGSEDYDSKNVIYTLVQTKKNDGTVSEENRILDKKSVVSADSVVQITVRGKGVYAGGEATGSYRILKKNCDIAKATIQIKNQSYTGCPVLITEQSQFTTGKVFIKIGNEKRELLLGEDMEVVPGSYIKNINRGTAKVTFRGIHDYGGTKTVSFKIGTRSVGDFWKGVFGGVSALLS